jgi:hypothetical protein
MQNQAAIREDSVRIAGRIIAFLSFLTILCCSPSGPESREDYLIRVADRNVTVRNFLQAFELAKTAYPQSAELGGSGLRGAQQKLLEEMAIELVILKRSDELGVSISEAEFVTALAAVTDDYPAGVFEQTLVESAVPLEAWKQRFRTRLLVEKLVGLELRDQVVITSEDVEAYYERHYQGKAARADSDGKFQRLKETIVADLRRKKIEEAYGDWVSGLKQKYPIKVNQKLWEQILEGGSDRPDSRSKDSARGN